MSIWQHRDYVLGNWKTFLWQFRWSQKAEEVYFKGNELKAKGERVKKSL